MDDTESEQPAPEDDPSESHAEGFAEGSGDERRGTPIPHTTWLVDYEGNGRYYIRRYSADGAINEIIRPQLATQLYADHHECHASAHATVFAYPGDTIVFSPAFSLIYAMKMRDVLEAILNRCPPRMPRRKHCPNPMWHTEDGIGVMKGNVHADQHSAFTGALAVNGFNLGLRGSNCAGTKRRWEWVEPEQRRGGQAGEN
jgi:hypothetical protein